MDLTVPVLRPDGSAEQWTLPFVIGLIADLSGAREAPKLAIDAHRFIPADDTMTHRPDDEAPDSDRRAGVRYLISTLARYPNVRIKMADLSKSALRRDFMRVVNVEESWLYRRLVDDAAAAPGREPFSVLVVDFEFGNDDRDLELLSRLTDVAGAALVPVLAAAGPGMFGLSDFETLLETDNPESIFDGGDYARWRSLREREAARFVTLTLPPAGVVRDQAGGPHSPAGEETVGPPAGPAQVTMNAAYLLGGRLAELFSVSRWWSALHVSEGRFNFASNISPRMAAGERPGLSMLDAALAKAGFAVLSNADGECAFHAPMTIGRPDQHDMPELAWIAQQTMRLVNVMAVSRFAHHLRNSANHFAQYAETTGDLEEMLGDWIGRYVRVVDPVTFEPVDRSRPLATAHISLSTRSGSDQTGVVVAHIRFGLPKEAPFATLNNRICFTVPPARKGRDRS